MLGMVKKERLPGMVLNSFNPSTQKTKVSRVLRVQGQPELSGEFQANPWLNNESVSEK